MNTRLQNCVLGASELVGDPFGLLEGGREIQRAGLASCTRLTGFGGGA